ncbi:Fer-1-like protein 4, partial [Eschrichtius robustus]|nr:Fer-1-like protein 4 [Eschrichtius robustus]
MLSGRRHVAWARIPAQDVLFSVVEEERGRDCGKIQSLLLTQAPGAAKLELFLGLELGKQAKACTSELPPDLLPEPSAGLPLSLDRDDFSYFQLRAHLYQAQGVLTAGDSGLSDLFARVLISTQCQTTRARTLAAPRVKLMEDPYQPPELQFFPLRKGPRAAGELIATFELIELDYSSQLEPSVPSDMEPQDLTALVEPLSRCLSLPPHVCPVLREFHVEVEQPQVVLEVAGRRVESEVLTSYCENSNFTELVRHLTVIHTPGSGGSPEEEGEEETGDLVPKAPQEQRSRDPFLAEVGIPRRLRKAPLEKLPLGGLLNQGPELEEDIPDPEELDWWSKYYALLQELQGQTNFDEDDMDDAGDSDGGNLLSVDGEAQDQGEAEVKGSVSQKKAIATLKVYNSSLEEEFNHFEDWLNVFPLYRGQGGQDGDGEEEGSGNLVGKFKGSYLIYPESEAVSFSELQISRGIPQNQPIKLLVRVYVVKSTKLKVERLA